jgi:outer membrane protein insertion porin family
VLCVLGLLALAPAARAADEGVRPAIEPRFVGSSPLSESEMEAAVREDLRRYEGFGRHPSYLEDASYRILVLLQARGYHHAKVSARVSREEGAPVAVFDVYSGPWVELRHVRFKGNAAFAEEDLAPFFERQKALPIEIEKRAFVLRDVKAGVSNLQDFYRNQGYLWVKAAIDQVTWEQDLATARVIVKVEEGPCAHLASVAFEGSDVPDDVLLEFLGKPIGQPFSPAWPLRARDKLLVLFAERGHPFCRVEVEPAVDEAARTVAARVRIVRGDRCRFGKVLPSENSLTLGSVVRHLSDFEIGGVYSYGAVREATNRLLRTGLFRSVEINASPGIPQRDLLDLRVRVEEERDWELSAAMGASDYAIALAEAQLLNRNVLGTGRAAWIKGSVAAGDMPTVVRSLAGLGEEAEPGDWVEFRAGRLEAAIRDPWLFYTFLGTEVKAYVEQRTETSFKVKRGVTIFPLDFPILEKIRGRISYEYRFEWIYDTDPGVTAPLEDFSASAVRISLRRDGRDDPYDPKWGTWVSLSHEFAGRVLRGGVDYDRSVIEAWGYAAPLGSFLTIALGGKGAIIDPKGRTREIPISLRFFEGGDSSVRSFWHHELGPHDARGKPAGGLSYLQFNAEARVRLGSVIGFALFFEGGSLKTSAAWWLHLDDEAVPPEERFRYAVGGGLRLNTPIGPLRLDFGWNPDPLPDEDPWAIHFSVGHPF